MSAIAKAHANAGLKLIDTATLLQAAFSHNGFAKKGGEIRYPVEEITVAGNLKDMYLNLRAAGNDVDTRGSIRSGSLLIDGLTIAGND